MGGSESRFVISSCTDERGSFWHAPASREKGAPIDMVPDVDTQDRLAKIVIKKDRELLNLRFDNHPQPYIGTSIDEDGRETVVFKGNTYDEDCRWSMMIIAISPQFERRWTPIQQKQCLEWDQAKGKDFLCAIMSRSGRILTYTAEKQLALIEPPKWLMENQDIGLNWDISFDQWNDWVQSVYHSLFVLKTVDHSLSECEVALATTYAAYYATTTVCLNPGFTALIFLYDFDGLQVDENWNMTLPESMRARVDRAFVDPPMFTQGLTTRAYDLSQAESSGSALAPISHGADITAIAMSLGLYVMRLPSPT